MAERIPARLSRGEARRFGLVVGAAFLLLAGFLWWRGRPVAALVCCGLGAVLLGLGLVAPGALRPVHRVWMGAAVAMSKVTTPIFLGIVYFGVITPIGIARRLFGGNPLKHRGGDGNSWVARDRQQTGMEHQF